MLFFRTVQTHLTSWLELSRNTRQGGSAPVCVERECRRHLECGIFVHDLPLRESSAIALASVPGAWYAEAGGLTWAQPQIFDRSRVEAANSSSGATLRDDKPCSW